MTLGIGQLAMTVRGVGRVWCVWGGWGGGLGGMKVSGVATTWRVVSDLHKTMYHTNDRRHISGVAAAVVWRWRCAFRGRDRALWGPY